jgi:hypothetical protein
VRTFVCLVLVALGAAACSDDARPAGAPARAVRVLHGADADYLLYEQTDGCLTLEVRVGGRAAIDGPQCSGAVWVTSPCFRAEEHVERPTVMGRSWALRRADSQAAPPCDRHLAEIVVWGRAEPTVHAWCVVPRDSAQRDRTVVVAGDDDIVFSSVAASRSGEDALLFAYTADGRPTPLPWQEGDEQAWRAGCFEAGPWSTPPPPAVRYPFALRVAPALKSNNGTLWVTTDEGTYVATSFGAFSGEWQGIGLELDLYRDTTHLNVGYGERWPERPVARVPLPPTVRAALASGIVCRDTSPILALDVRAGLLANDPQAVSAWAVPLAEAVQVDPLARELSAPCR